MAVQTPVINEDKLNAFMGQVVGELGATVNAGLIVLPLPPGIVRAVIFDGEFVARHGQARCVPAGMENPRSN